MNAFFRDGLQRCTGQGGAENLRRVRPSWSPALSQTGLVRFRESSSFFPNKRLECWSLGQMIQVCRVQAEEVEGRDPRVWLPCYLCTLFPWR